MIRRRHLVVLLGLWASAAFAQDTGAQDQAEPSREKKLEARDLHPPPPPVRVDSDAVKLPDQQFQIPPDHAVPEPPPPDEPASPPDEPPPPKKSKKKNAR